METPHQRDKGVVSPLCGAVSIATVCFVSQPVIHENGQENVKVAEQMIKSVVVATGLNLLYHQTIYCISGFLQGSAVQVFLNTTENTISQLFRRHTGRNMKV